MAVIRGAKRQGRGKYSHTPFLHSSAKKSGFQIASLILSPSPHPNDPKQRHTPSFLSPLPIHVIYSQPTMQDTLNFPTSTSTANPLLRHSNPVKSPSFLRIKPSILAALSSSSSKPTSTATSLPLKPSKFPPFHQQTRKLKSLDIISTSNPNPDPDPDPDPDAEFHEKALFLDSIGLDSLSLLSTASSSAAVTAASLSDLKAVFDYLSSFGFTGPDLRRVVSMCPELLSLRVKDIVPVFTFLLREAKVAGDDLRRVICRRPRLLASDVETRLRPTLYFLQSIGIHEVNRHTNLLSASVEDKFIPKIEYFEKVGFCYRDSISMFRRFPPLFCYSVKENFEPKFNYFVVEMGRDLKELKEFPQYFSFSLERRIKPRHQMCVEQGVCFPLPVMLKMKEEVFRQKLDVCCDSSMPRSTSPLWCANNCDLNSM